MIGINSVYHRETRKPAIAKALQLEDRFGKFRLATTNAEHLTPRPLSTLNKQQIRTDFAVNLRCLLHTL